MAVTREALPSWVIDLTERPVIRSAASLFGTTVVTSVLGLAYSVVAARMFPISATGVAFPALSAMQLLGQLGLIGIATMLIGRLAQGDFAPGLVSAGAITATGVTFLLGVAFVLLQTVFSTHLGSLGHGLLGPGLFALGCGITAFTLVLDQATVGLGQTRAQLRRNGAFAIVKLVLLPVGTLVPLPGAAVIYATWLVGNLVSLVPYWRALRQAGVSPVVRPHFPALLRERWTVMAHHWLNMADQAPRLLITVLVAALLTPQDAAAFYAANLLVAFPTIVPVHLTLALFALPRGQINRLANEARATLRVSFAVSLVSAVGIAAVAYPMLYVFGPHYVIATVPMAVLGLNILPYSVKVHYAAVERVHGRLRRCATVSSIGAVLEIGLCIVGAEQFGLVGVSAGLVLGLTIEAIFLWPVVARAAQVPILGNPSWLWHHETASDGNDVLVPPAVVSPAPPEPGTPEPLQHGETNRSGQSRQRDDVLEPEDQLLLRATRLGTTLRNGSRRQRMQARFELPFVLVRLARNLRRIPRHLLELSPTARGETMAELLRPPSSPFPALAELRYVLELGPQRRGRGAVPGDRAGTQLRLVRLRHPATAYAAYTVCQGRSPVRPRAGDEQVRAVQELTDSVTVAAIDDRQIVVGLGTVLADGVDAYLVALVSRSERQDGDLALELVHEDLIGRLADAGVRRLWTDGPFTSESDPAPLRASAYRAALLRLEPGIGWS